MSESYYQVPSDGALTEKQAKQVAAKRWRIFDGRRWDGYPADGIQWMGDNGVTETRTWAQLNSKICP